MTSAPPLRSRTLGDAGLRPEGDFVLYWMTATRRLGWNFALDRALELARELGKPLVIFEPINADYRWASVRHHRFVLDGMAEHAEATATAPVTYFPYVEPEAAAGRGLLRALADHACTVVTDDSPVFFTPQLLRAAAGIEGVRVEAIDSCGLLPLRAAGQVYNTAYSFRRFLHKELPEHLGDTPDPEPLTGLDLPRLDALPDEVVERWASTPADSLGTDAALEGLPIDRSVGAVEARGGAAAARARLERFLEEGVDVYADARNQVDPDPASGLSPWLHYGHISAHEIFRAVTDREEWTPLAIDPPADGRRKGWWGMSEGAEAFLDQLVTWRELGYVYCTYEPDYAEYETLPEWARETLEAHQDDPRPELYSLDALAAAETGDEIWNAAQRQLLGEGVIHNYLRMLWGKKILEWTPGPREALEVMVELNNRYAIDGRDPNSYSGIMWTLGRFDRGWPEREVFGKVRSMTSRSTRRKLSLDRYLDRWGSQPGLDLDG